MKIKNLWKFYKISKNWEIIDGKVSIPDTDLPQLDIRDGHIVLEQEYNPKSDERGQFLPDMTEDDFTKWQQQKSGWSKFYDKVKNL